ncbi:N-alpha-acetyltransferase 15, NatA auxiliary subunit isoform X1 [Hydra vulgaris]|uniref:N-alpha-acetyltransferase 15, NatA auxiliary subunit n=1 Tax=Hydra vulgaris TaxID=6087 RepID=T2M5N8_HYDVU|nr:N-alpha-acetyltransferase 15, NatA auxiliary subunit [Hydra vulgaris]XP_047141011.1 N-alpha-acetyltransferase 15, NatA auxiliary subunit [Hydra vulgaris]XP_047141018.1 N-alpha-acetyltransferase 15, NatA auxiliary subunit [Hydra vulgaris]XP_047141025.1 N-alpha-acetyltransferase 15, NatA auxiliary subunit [Hydra vulgaris]
MPSQLPPKENTIFKRILKCYEQKQYKNGLKFCKQILSNPKFAEHGETLAMKGLTLSYLGRKDESYEYVKRGLKNDLRSHVCWHVYGLLQRADHKYDEAIKCYRNALKWDKDNIQILRDLSLLQVQMRDSEGFRDTRYQLLKIRPAQRQSWIGYSISYYLLGDYDMAFSVMEDFRKTIIPENSNKVDFEHSEMLLYQNMVLSEQGKIKESLQHLEKYENLITDKLKVSEIKASQHMQLGNFSVAEKIYRNLLKRNPENHMYYEAIEKCTSALKQKSLEESDRLAIYLYYKKRYPWCETPRRLPLNFTSGNLFKELLSDYLQNALKKGIPPLFKNLQNLYQNTEKVLIIENMVNNFAKNLLECNKFDPKDGELQDPTVLLWTEFYLAQHYDYIKDTEKALFYINKVLDHTPTLIEGYMVKAKIYKHAGAYQEAANWMDEGRSLDTADRYVNSKCAKYLLRANEIQKAIETCGMFTKEGSSPDDDLDSMQCMWFGNECAAAHYRREEIGEALRKCHQIEKNFNEIVEDQFDFHTYCMRKVTLCAYIKLLKLEDVIRNHSFYFDAARIAIKCYIELYDKPYSSEEGGAENNKGSMSDKEFKKLKSKQRRAQKKQQIEEEKKDHKEVEMKKNDDGKPDPLVLVKCKNPLEEAVKFLRPLQLLSKQKIETHLMAYEIYSRTNKPLLMLQSVKRAYHCDPTNSQLHCCLVEFLAKVREEAGSYNAIVKLVIDRELPLIVREQDPFKFNDDYLLSNPNSLKTRIAVGWSKLYLDPSSKDEAIKLITDLTTRVDLSLQVCVEVYEKLISKGLLTEARNYKLACHQVFPRADLFRPDNIVENDDSQG